LADKASWWRRRIEKKDATFERWVAQQGTQFLPTNPAGWPIAEMSAGLQLAISLYDAGPSSYAAIYRSQPSVYTVVDFLARQMSQLKLKVYQRVSDTDRESLGDSPLARLLRDPAPGLTYTRLIHRTVADLCVYGNACWVKLTPPPGIIGGRRSIVPLPFEKVTIRGGNLVEADSYEFGIGAQRRSFPAEQIVHFRSYSPEDLRIGVSPLEPLRRIIAEEASASAAREVFWRKSARMDGMLERPFEAPKWDDNAFNRFRESWRRFAKGGDLEGETPVLEDGMKFNPTSFSPKDAEFIAGRKLILETVARAFHIPLAVLSLTESATYASQREFHKALYQDTLGQWTRALEDEIQAELVPWFTDDESVYVEFNIEEKMRGAFEDQAKMILEAVGGPYMYRNEGRALLNLPKDPDPASDQLVITNNMVGTETEPEETAPVVQIAPSSQAEEAS
jgi:HK97 family phage portal protein